MWPYPWTHVGTPSHLGHMDRVAATMPSQAHAGAAQEAPDKGQWEGKDVPLVRPSSCNVKEGIPSSRRYLPTYLRLESQSSAGLRMQPYPRVPDLVWPGQLHGTGCLSARAVDTGFPTVVRRLCLGPGCGWVTV